MDGRQAHAVDTAGAALQACPVRERRRLTPHVVRITPCEKQQLDFAMQFPPSDEALGPSGSACEYGGIRLQIDPFASPKSLEKDAFGKWQRVFTIQMDVPPGRTAESIKSNVIALAREILPKLR